MRWVKKMLALFHREHKTTPELDLAKQERDWIWERLTAIESENMRRERGERTW